MKTNPRAAWSRCLAAVLLSACACTAWAADPKASQYYEDALQRFEKKDHKGAIVQLRNALKLDRKMLQSQVLLGKAQIGRASCRERV